MKTQTVGDSPSGKALGSGPTIRGFESLIPSQFVEENPEKQSFSGKRRKIKNLELALVFFIYCAAKKTQFS